MMFPISRIAWHQGAGHIVSAVRKQREMNGGGGRLSTFSFSFSPEPQSENDVTFPWSGSSYLLDF